MKEKCIFCQPEREIIIERESCFAIYDKFPVSKGHMLIIPYRHEPDYFQLSQKEKSALWQLVDDVKSFLDKKYQPDGYNVGFNLGQSAGQTVAHAHIHVIPRYEGDMKRPEGGVRHVVAGRGYYR